MDGVREITGRSYETLLHPVAIAFTLLMALWMIRSRRSQAVLPIVLVACLIPAAQRILIGGFDFTMVRMLILVGIVRVAAKGELNAFKPIPLDYALVLWIASASMIYTIREGSFAAFVSTMGSGLDTVGIYFLLRCLLRTPRDIENGLRIFAGVTVLIGFFMAIEWLTARNMFHVFGGVREITWVRDGRLRCQGAFSHPIMAGTFGATMAPFFVGLWLQKAQGRWLAIAGLVAAFFVVLFSASSGAVVAFAASLFAWVVWRYRVHLRAILWGGLAAAIFVHFAREKPIWHLMARAASLVGGTGFHRYKLIDAWIQHFPEWWLLGTNGMKHWGWGLQDVTNQFVLEGVRGGLLTLVAFVALLTVAFRTLGAAMRWADKRLEAEDARRLRLLAWALGASLFTHMVSFTSVSYFGQMESLLFILFAMIGGLHPRMLSRLVARPVSETPAASGVALPASGAATADASAGLSGLLHNEKS